MRPPDTFILCMDITQILQAPRIPLHPISFLLFTDLFSKSAVQYDSPIISFEISLCLSLHSVMRSCLLLLLICVRNNAHSDTRECRRVLPLRVSNFSTPHFTFLQLPHLQNPEMNTFLVMHHSFSQQLKQTHHTHGTPKLTPMHAYKHSPSCTYAHTIHPSPRSSCQLIRHPLLTSRDACYCVASCTALA